MAFSVFDLFKIGIGPSSSHTCGPMVAGRRFVDDLRARGLFDATERVTARLHGSLAWTGKGHASDKATLLGLSGERPETIDPEAVDGIVARIAETGRMNLGGERDIAFSIDDDLVFDYEVMLPAHSNGMCVYAYDGAGQQLHKQIYYSIGGGFVATDAEMDVSQAAPSAAVEVPYDYRSADALLAIGRDTGLSFRDIAMANEQAWRTEADVIKGLDRIWETMKGCMDRGMATPGELPGGLHVRRRARQLHEDLQKEERRNFRMPHTCLDWISLYALAVNEENAAGGRIVTAPTNGAAGVIPAVIRYYIEFCPDADRDGIHTLLLVAAQVGGLIKMNASISGAEAGCQGEVGSACAMAAGGLAAALGGTNEQVENAAEIGLEHHLGMTCDPVGGLVQIPCIERNAMGAVKAINAASLALHGDGQHYVSLDQVIETMRQTGADMQAKYKETSQGGLAVNVVEC
ncbi:MAG: L-serine ammonia-lyase [Rhodospirillales bacterium]